MIANNYLCRIDVETNSLKESLTLQPFDDIGGDCPNHRIHVGRFYWLLPFLVAWARGFQVGLLPLVWLAVSVLAAMGNAITSSVQHGNVWPLVLGSRRIYIRCMMLSGVVSCH